LFCQKEKCEYREVLSKTQQKTMTRSLLPHPMEGKLTNSHPVEGKGGSHGRLMSKA
jgi:hypothetical protein